MDAPWTVHPLVASREPELGGEGAATASNPAVPPPDASSTGRRSRSPQLAEAEPSGVRVPSAAPNKNAPEGALFGAAEGTRTPDTRNHNPVL